MAEQFKLPDLGESVESAGIGSILVNVGDIIAAKTVILELESEKATLPIEIPFGGKITALHVKPGDTVKSGSPILSIEKSAGTTPAPASKTASPTPVKPDAAPAKARTSSATDNGPPAASAASAKTPAAATQTRATTAATATAVHDRKAPAPAAPATRRLARELGVDLYLVGGSAAGGRITRDDVKAFFQRQAGGGSGGAIVAPPLPDFSPYGEVERRPMSAIAKATARNLSIAWQTIPHVTQHELADVTDLEAARRAFVKAKPKLPKITMTVLAMKAVLAAVKEFPHFNASYDADASEVVIKKHYHFGVAVDTEHGLLVPVVRDVDQKTVVQLAAEVTELAEKARTKKLDLSSMKGGTFTISNLGGLGGTFFTPIVNWPEVAILGLSRSRQEYTEIEGNLQFRLMLPLSLSYDHRVINGADGARFVTRLAQFLADPFAMLAET